MLICIDDQQVSIVCLYLISILVAVSQSNQLRLIDWLGLVGR